MKTIVIYKSKTGYTKKYAQMIAEELSADLYKVSQLKPNKLYDYDTIIYGGGIYAGGINGIKLLKKDFNKIKSKNIIVFATGLSAEDDKMIEQCKNDNFTPEQLKYVQFYYLRGGLNYNKLSVTNKLMMNIIKKVIKSKNKKGETVTSDDASMLSAFDAPVDYTQRENIDGIVKSVEEI